MESEEDRKPAKRTHSEYAAQDSDAGAAAGSEDGSLDDDGPTAQLPSSEARPKKRRVLPFERLYADALPRGTRYSRSLMHKDQLSFLTLTAQTDFLITSSVDGVVKFWKKVAQGIEYVKEIRAHEGAVVSVSASADGRSYASAGADGLIRIFDVITFDLLATIILASAPGCICWTHKKGASLPLLAVGEESSPLIHIFDGRGDRQAPIHTIKGLHKSPVAAMAFNDTFDCVVSADRTGMIEYWRPGGRYEKPDNVFEYKSSTDLFDLKKAKSAPCCITISPSGHRFAVLSLPDHMIRIFDFATAKLYRTYDESLRALEGIQQAGPHKLEPIEFGRRIALEREVGSGPMGSMGNVVFDESGHFIVYGSMLGAKVLNTYTNRVMRIYGQDDNLRILNIAIYQGAPQKKGVTTIEMGASSNPLLQESEARDPILVATAAGKHRFYMFTNDEAVAKSSSRDVQNEKPAQAVVAKKARAEPKKAETGTAAIVHTTFGDIQIRLYPGFAPKAVENFVTHSRKGYYNGTIFHRVIRKFMLQCGDPLGDGTGGESIWGKEFADEFSTLKHDKPYTVSMANAGPNTNGSQFFITTEVTPWLDGRHTIFGRATQGLDVIHKIESVKTHKDKPIQDIKIISIDVI